VNGMTWLVIGIDPGPAPGIVALHDTTTTTRRPVASVIQCDYVSCVLFVSALLSTVDTDAAGRLPILAVEQFVVGPRAARSRTPAAGVATRDLIGALRREFADVAVQLRPAARVKPWATDARLAAAGLLDVTRGMPHARDAARHALYAAVRNRLMPDPLSRKVRAP
jgi:hypothetical protein